MMTSKGNESNIGLDDMLEVIANGLAIEIVIGDGEKVPRNDL